ncbi:MAG: hypothetical protein IJA65_00330 [Acholeplasmatales bacterium]|nr:hypothetical protein [Acholeplasmatales bacterium]
MNYKIKEYMSSKNHSVGFLRLLSAELYEDNKELSDEFLKLALKKREYEELLLKVIEEIDRNDILLKNIISKAYYDYDEYNNLTFSSEKEEIAYLLEMIKNEEEELHNKNTIIKSYLNDKAMI